MYVVSSNPHVDVVLTTIIYPTIVGDLETSLYGYPKKTLGDNMSVVFKALGVESHYLLFNSHWISEKNEQTLYSHRPLHFSAGVLLTMYVDYMEGC